MPQKKGFAHSFAYGESNRGHVLNVGQITINSGQIGGILGFQTAALSGPAGFARARVRSIGSPSRTFCPVHRSRPAET